LQRFRFPVGSGVFFKGLVRELLCRQGFCKREQVERCGLDARREVAVQEEQERGSSLQIQVNIMELIRL
jgi:hypothetical protein